MKHTRVLFVIFLVTFVCSSSLGQGITDIDRTKKTKKERKATPSYKPKTKHINKKGSIRKTETIFSISSLTAQFSANGGSKTFTINSNNPWNISTQTRSWGKLSRKGNELTLQVDANRSTSKRTDYFELSSGSKILRVDITQSGETVFSISSNTARFEVNGGSKTFYVSSNGSWDIKTKTTTWGHLAREGNTLTLRVDANPYASERKDYFEISSGYKTIRVDITQSGGTNLSVSNDKLNFTSSGGTQTITVSTNESWEISLGTASWGKLTKRGNQLLVTIDANNSSESRTDYFRIRAGSKTVQINISQSGTYSLYSQYIQDRSQQRHNRVNNSGSHIKFGLEVMDFGIITNDLSSNSKDILIYYYNLGISIKFGNYKDPLQFEVGAKPGVVHVNYDDYEYGKYGYTYSTEVDKNYFHMPIFTKLKINICDVNGSKLYIAGLGTYNAIRDKTYENEYSAGGGFGLAWKKWDWFAYYKQDIDNKSYFDNSFIGTSFVRYF